MTVLLWGFYDEGNLGDDLMAVMVAELVKSIGLRPVILSRSTRFKKLGYAVARRIDDVDAQAIVLAGGAFIKGSSASQSSLDARVDRLASFLARSDLPVLGLSMGSDGVDALSEASAGRRAVLSNPSVIGVAVRLKKDLALGLPRAVYLPDIVLATRHFHSAWSGHTDRDSVDPPFFINLSRRTVFNLPLALYLGRSHRMVSFLAHNSMEGRGGEVVIPLLSRLQADDLERSVFALGECAAILSSKLHPGMIALAMGSDFIAVSPRPKTRDFIAESEADGLVERTSLPGGAIRVRASLGPAWQASLWAAYQKWLVEHLTIANILIPCPEGRL